MVSRETVADAVRQLGLSGRALCVHASLRSFGKVEGGAPAVVDGLLAEGCTVMVPSFSWLYAVPPERAGPARNACPYEPYTGIRSGVGRIYTPDTLDIDAGDMGAISVEVVTRPGRARGAHPLCSFSAVGPMADALVSGQRPLNVGAPLKKLAETGGAVVLMGVGLNKMTLIHTAEQMAGRNAFRRWANGPDGRPAEAEAGGCSDGFSNFEPILAPIVKTQTVGESCWRVFPAEEALRMATDAIREDPMVTHCGDVACGRCNDAVAGGPILDQERPMQLTNGCVEGGQ